MTTPDEVSGPIDFLMLSFDPSLTDGRAGAALAALVEAGTIALYDFCILQKGDDGSVVAVDLSATPAGAAAGLLEFAGARSGLLTDDDIAEAGSAMAPGSSAALFVYENAWARPFVAAATDAGAQVLATARISAQDLVDVLDALDAAANQG